MYMSHNSSSTAHLGNVIQPRNNSLGLNLPQRQAFTVPANLKSEVVILPSTSAPAFGSYFIFDVKERNCIISDITLQFNVGNITGLSGTATSYPHFSPGTLLHLRLKLLLIISQWIHYIRYQIS